MIWEFKNESQSKKEPQIQRQGPQIKSLNLTCFWAF